MTEMSYVPSLTEESVSILHLWNATTLEGGQAHNNFETLRLDLLHLFLAVNDNGDVQ